MAKSLLYVAKGYCAFELKIDVCFKFRFTRAQLFKTNDIVCKWDVKFFNRLYAKTLPFLAKNVGAFTKAPLLCSKEYQQS